MFLIVRIVSALSAVPLALVVAGALPDSAVASGWSIQPTLDGPSQGALNRVSCTAASACIAVGSAVNSSGATQTLAEQWNGSQWVVLATPPIAGASSGSLSDVSCTAANACIAVGDYINASGAQQMLAEQWTGSTWSMLPAPSSGGELTRVSCSAANACTALGQGGAYRWNGTTWSSQTFALPTHAKSTDLNGVSCLSATDCAAVGWWFGTVCNNNQPTCNCFRLPGCTSGGWRLAEQWNGTGWTVQTSPGQGILSDVSCTSTGCLAVGALDNILLGEQWTGGAWEETLPLSTSAGDGLFGVSCTSVNYCVAVGYTTNSSGAQVTLAEQWYDNGWDIGPIPPTPPGAVSSQLTGVSCTAFSTCTAVGYYQNQSNLNTPIAEGYSPS